MNFASFTQQDITLYFTALIIAAAVVIISRRLFKISFPYFFMGIVGISIGLWIGSLLSSPFANMTSPYNHWLPLIVDIVITVAVFDLFIAQARPIVGFFGRIGNLINHWIIRAGELQTERSVSDILVDTSALIDGRIVEVARTGFVFGTLIVPRFVLQELQTVADQADPLKRARGRRGLDVLADMQKIASVEIELSDEALGKNEQVDSKLVKLARQRKCKILTVDFNLNRVAQIQGVEVLNINELATALRPQVIPGESLIVQILQKGKEKNQGIGYLPDGTMIVVENGEDYVGETIECEVVRIFQSVAGKMIFVEPKVKGRKSNE